MTSKLKKAISKLEKMPVAKQNEFARFILENLEWEHRFENSQDELLMLANEALGEYKKGKTRFLKL